MRVWLARTRGRQAGAALRYLVWMQASATAGYIAMVCTFTRRTFPLRSSLDSLTFFPQILPAAAGMALVHVREGR
ncbi:hypothetical protein BD310DRAFT_931660 [Dichomitus squalens]|uniref:Uncharacterized protein n=1 Tax=Dichomitus squalens TaxID=114155 RepID=A0A4Q9PPP4_9APHY|nr:hypothetical protein BD310DRAFT_931660 [Dichomitus squalens]